MSHPLTDALPDYLDALALRQACGEIEERVTRERDEARALNASWAEKAATWMASQEAAQRLQGYRDLGQQAAQAQNERDALRAEVERLTSCLKRANEQAEEFERKWYLRADEVERLQTLVAQARDEEAEACRKIAFEMAPTDEHAVDVSQAIRARIAGRKA